MTLNNAGKPLCIYSGKRSEPLICTESSFRYHYVMVEPTDNTNITLDKLTTIQKSLKVTNLGTGITTHPKIMPVNTQYYPDIWEEVTDEFISIIEYSEYDDSVFGIIKVFENRSSLNGDDTIANFCSTIEIVVNDPPM